MTERIADRVAQREDLKAIKMRAAEQQRAKDDLQEAFDKSPIGMVWTTPAGILVQANPVFCRMLGRRETELVGRTSSAYTHPLDVTKTQDALLRATVTPESHLACFEQRYLHADGSVVWVEVYTLITRAADGAPRCLVSSVLDVTQRRASERAIVNQANFLEAVLENVNSGVMACDAEGRMTLFNRAIREMHHVPWHALPAEAWAEHFKLFRTDGKTPLPMLETPLVRALAGEDVRNAELMIRDYDGDLRTMVAHGRRLSDADGAVLGAVVTTHDVTASRAAQAALNRQALHDPLTDLPNRALLRDRLETAIARQTHRPDPLALLLLDLDGFKVVNDSLGHQAGDELLVTLAERLRGCVRPDDTIARLGGDEFAIVLENVSEGRAWTIAAEILSVIREPITIQGRSISSDASVGIMMSHGAETPDTLLRNADLAMYSAKDLGKGNVQVFTSSMHDTVLERLTLQSDLREAIDKGHFTVAYQPIVSLVSGRLQAFEALLRWTHPVRGVIPPSTFIPLAESTGLMLPLGEWVLREACRQARTWQRHPGTADVAMSVNLSVRQLKDPEILNVVMAALKDYAVPPGLLHLEITEGVLDERGSPVTILESLHACGVRLVLDDFGSGYSSLHRLHALPIDQIKIDKSFIDVLAGGGAAPMVAATLAMARSLGLKTVAEGVETVDQVPFLRRHGCDEVQGYLYGHPVSAAAIDALLRERGSGTGWSPTGTWEIDSPSTWQR